MTDLQAYTRVHTQLARRAKPSCCALCGESRALVWAFTGAGHEAGAHAYGELSDYQAMCRTCHFAFDKMAAVPGKGKTRYW
jgi:hypothetical protein